MVRPVIRLKAGDDRSIPVALLNPSGEPRNITGEVVEFRAAVNLDASSSLIYKSDGDGIEVLDAVEGRVNLVFRPSDTISASFPPICLWEMAIINTMGLRETQDFSAVGSTDGPATYGLLVVERPLVAS